MRIYKALLLTVILQFSMPGIVQAGVYSDDLGKCLVNTTTKNERQQLVKVIFAGIAKHPSTSYMADISTVQEDEFMRQFASIFTDLMTERCVEQARLAIRYEGLQAIENSFELLGKIAVQDLMTHPAINAYFEGMATYIDENALNALVK